MFEYLTVTKQENLNSRKGKKEKRKKGLMLSVDAGSLCITHTPRVRLGIAYFAEN